MCSVHHLTAYDSGLRCEYAVHHDQILYKRLYSIWFYHGGGRWRSV